MKHYFNFDRRYFQLASLTIFLIIFLLRLDGDRVIQSILPTLIFGFVLDSIITKIRFKNWTFPVSGLITSLACIMLMKTQLLIFPYILAIAISISSKLLFADKFGHFFNPANFGLLMVILILPDKAGILASQWVVSPAIYALMTSIGLFVSYINRRLLLSLSYLAFLVMLRFAFAQYYNISLEFFLGAIVNSATLIFAFHMITDPKTSPSSKKGQIVLGLLVAILDFILRYYAIPFAPLLALSLVCAVINPFREQVTWARS